MSRLPERSSVLLASIRANEKELELTKEQLQQTERELKDSRRQLRQLAREHVLYRMPRKSVCAEIGVDEGEFAGKILSTVEPKRLHLIDPWRHLEDDRYQDSRYGGLGVAGQAVMDERHEEVAKRFDEEVRNGQVHVHRSLSSSVYDEFEDHYFNWIYLDGNHLYEFIKQDLELYYPKVKPGGCIAGDDYGAEGWWENGVQRAVDEFVESNPGSTLQVYYTQFVIEKNS